MTNPFEADWKHQALTCFGSLGAEYPSQKKINLISYGYICPKKLKVTYSAPKGLKLSDLRTLKKVVRGLGFRGLGV